MSPGLHSGRTTSSGAGYPRVARGRCGASCADTGDGCCSGGGSFPGLRTGTSIRCVSQYIPNGPCPYVPVQRRPFALVGSVVNRGSFPVTIMGVSRAPGSPSSPAGPVRYLTS